MKIGLIGCGHWGPNYIKTFNRIEGSNIEIVCDKDESKLKTISDIKTTTNLDDILLNRKIEAVIIATPATTHFDLCKEALIHNKHILVEKPLTTKVDEAVELSKRAEHMEKVLMPGHIFEYNNSIDIIKQVISQGRLGDIRYIYSQRTNDGPVRGDVGASWDLALHDISIFNYIFNDVPVKVSARGLRYMSKSVEDTCFIQLNYDNDVVVEIHCSWCYPRKVRTIDVVGSRDSLMFDETNIKSPSTLCGIKVEKGNSLLRECNEFINNIKTNNINGEYLQRGIDCVKVLEAIQLSQRLNGVEVTL